MFCDNKSSKLRALLDTGATGYSFIDEVVAQIVCNGFGIEPVCLLKPKPLRGFDGQRAEPITHAIYPSLSVQHHTENTAPMLITKLGHYQAILGKPWMNVQGVALDMMYDRLICLPGRCCHAGAPTQLAPHPRPLPDLRITPCMPYTPQQAYEIVNSKPKPLPMPPPTPPTSPISILKRSTSSPVPELKASRPLALATTPGRPDVAMIGVAAYVRLNSPKYQAKGVKSYSTTIQQIDSTLQAYRIHIGEEEPPVEINEVGQEFTKKPTLDKIHDMLPSEFEDLLPAFDPDKAEELPPNRACDHKIELTGDPSSVRSRIYPQSYVKLLALKKYLEQNLRKGFISPSTAPYSSPVLFGVKPNGGLRFCVDYRRLNAITKRNRYPFL